MNRRRHILVGHTRFCLLDANVVAGYYLLPLDAVSQTEGKTIRPEWTWGLWGGLRGVFVCQGRVLRRFARRHLSGCLRRGRQVAIRMAFHRLVLLLARLHAGGGQGGAGGPIGPQVHETDLAQR